MSRPKICYIYSEQPDYVRVEKVLKTLSILDVDLFYIGCCRGNQSKRSVKPIVNTSFHVADFKVPHGGLRSALSTLRFLCFAVYKYVIIRPDLVIAVNEEIALPFVLLFRRASVICEAYDSLSMRAPESNIGLNLLLKNVSRFVLGRCKALIEVSNERLISHKVVPSKSIIVPNTLDQKSRNACQESNGLLDEMISNRDYVFVSGSFSDSINGLEQLLEVIEGLEGKITIIAAGRPNGEWVNNTFIKHKLVKFLGNVSPSDAIYLASKSKGIFAYYKPISELYRYAAPNKIFDAMAVGVPVFINEDCMASKFAVSNGFGLTARYSDIRKLKSNVEIALESANFMNREKVQKTFSDCYSWSIVSKNYSQLIQSLIGQGQ